MHFIKRCFHEPKHSFFLFGPRGSGKTTMIQHHFPDSLWVDLLRPDTLRTFSARPERLFELVEGHPEKTVIVIDEVQKVPSLLSAAHALIESHKEKQFIFTGSSARKLKRAGADLLAGRAIRRNLYPFIAAELGESFKLSEALHVGMLPLIINASDPKEVLETYVGMYLKEEIQEEGLVRSLESFSLFLEIVSFSHAQVLNVTNIARECEAKRKTVENYIEILEDLLLAYRIPIFTKRAQRVMSSHPKFYLFDAGVFRTLRPTGPLDRPEEIEGAALEGLVAQHLVAWNEYSREKQELFFWRTRSGLEVDFIVYGSKHFYAIEVKHSSRVLPQDLRGLKAFMQDYPTVKPYFLYMGSERLLIDNILCLPVAEFLAELNPLAL